MALMTMDEKNIAKYSNNLICTSQIYKKYVK